MTIDSESKKRSDRVPVICAAILIFCFLATWFPGGLGHESPTRTPTARITVSTPIATQTVLPNP